MGMGPVFAGRAAQQQQQQQQQSYMDQFNNAQYAAIPGVRGQQPLPAPPPPAIINGQPVNPNPGPLTSWGRGMANLMEPTMAELRSLYMNGALSNADWQSFLPGGAEGGPGQIAGQMQNHMVRPQPSVASQMMTGPYGRQAAQMAGLLGRPGEGYPTGGGLLGGPKGGYRPGGK